MPRTCRVAPWFADLRAAQDEVVHRSQAYAAGLSRHAVAHRVACQGWQELLPNVFLCHFLCHAGEPSRRQLRVAALAWAGEPAAIDGADACAFHGIRAVPLADEFVFIVVPASSTARSTGFVVVRRSSAALSVVRTDRLRYVDPATAVVSATRRMHHDRGVLAAFSDAVQRRIVSPEELVRAHVRGPRRNARRGSAALEQIRVGVRSATEADFRLLAEASALLPPLLYNALLRLPSGAVVSPDALALDAGVVHETNGASAHRRDDLFQDMQLRHDAMTESGLIVLHNPPRRIRLQGHAVLGQFERVYVRHAGRGLPPGVELLRAAA